MADDRPIAGPTGLVSEAGPGGPVVSELYGFLFRIEDATEWQLRFGEDVREHKPRKSSEVCIEINGHKAMMTLNVFMDCIFGEAVTNDVFSPMVGVPK